MTNWSDLIVPVDRDPPGTPAQRGSIEARHAWHLKTVIQAATVMGTKVLGIENPLEVDIERTPDRVQKVDAALKVMAKAQQQQLGDFKPQQFVDYVMAELFGLGPLDRFLAEPDVSEIMVNGPFVVFIERAGKIAESGHKFLDDAHLERIIRRIVRPLGRSIGPDSPLVDARLPDGSRVNAAVAPCTLDGPSVTIRKFSNKKMALTDLVDRGAMSAEMVKFLAAIVAGRQNIVVSGGTGSGKTTLINALSQHINDGERVVTIEDAAELKLVQRNVVRLETKRATHDNPHSVTIRDCLANALRMRPERILIGECRGAEALDMLQAMNTGHDGSMTTVHANTPRDSISRLETLALMGGLDLPLMVLRRQIASAVHFIVQVSRMRDGSRKVTHITEVQRMEGDIVVLSDIFVWQEQGRDGRVQGSHRASGNRPGCLDDLARAGHVFPANFFFTPSDPGPAARPAEGPPRGMPNGFRPPSR